MENENMDSNGVFWNNVWRTVATVVIVLILTIAVSGHYSSIRYYEAWNNCVVSGGQPVSQPMVGTETTTFTCVQH